MSQSGPLIPNSRAKNGRTRKGRHRKLVGCCGTKQLKKKKKKGKTHGGVVAMPCQYFEGTEVHNPDISTPPAGTENGAGSTLVLSSEYPARSFKTHILGLEKLAR